MKSLTTVALIALLLQPAAAATGTYSIDVILPLTGPGAFAGQSQEQAARVYEKVVNQTGGIHGQMLHFEIHDDQSSPTVDVQLANEILQKHPIAVLGPSLSANCSAIAPLFVNGPVNFCFSPLVEPPKGGYVFASAVPIRTLLGTSYAQLHALGYKRFAVLFSTDASGQAEGRLTKDWFAQPESQNVQLVALESFAPTDLSIAAQVAKIKAAGPDILVIWAIGTAFGTAIRELANSGLNVPVFTTPSSTTAAQLAQYASVLPKTLVATGMPYQAKARTNVVQAASSEYLDGLKNAGLKTDTMQSYAWDPMKLTVTALRVLPPNPTASQLHDTLENLHDVAGIWGAYDFRTGDQHGIAGKDIPFMQWDQAHGTWSPFNGPPAK